MIIALLHNKFITFSKISRVRASSKTKLIFLARHKSQDGGNIPLHLSIIENFKNNIHKNKERQLKYEIFYCCYYCY